MLSTRATFCVVCICVICVFCLLVVLIRLSVPVQVIDWKDSFPKWPIMCWWGRKPHSLTSTSVMMSQRTVDMSNIAYSREINVFYQFSPSAFYCLKYCCMLIYKFQPRKWMSQFLCCLSHTTIRYLVECLSTSDLCWIAKQPQTSKTHEKLFKPVELSCLCRLKHTHTHTSTHTNQSHTIQYSFGWIMVKWNEW